MATIIVPNFKKENEVIVPTFEKKKKEKDQEEPTTQLEKDFPNMSVSEIIDTGGKGYTEEEKLQNIIVPDISKKGFFEKALPITYKQIEYIWKEPIGLSEENKKIFQKLIGDENTLLGKYNNILLDSLSAGIDTTLRSLNTVGFAFTGFAGDALNGIYEAIDKNPNGAGERLTRDLNIMLIDMMGRSGTSFSSVPKKNNTLKSKKTNEEFTDVFAYANKNPENKIEVKKNIEKIIDNELTELKKSDTIIGESLNTVNKTIETNKVKEIVKAKDEVPQQPKTIDTIESINRSPALNQKLVDQITEASVKFANEENIKLVPTKEKPLSLQMQEIFLSDKYDAPYVIRKIAEDNKIPVDTFLNYIFPSVSKSAKEMAAWSRASRYLKDKLDPTGQLVAAGERPLFSIFKKLDNIRRGLLVTRIATAVRNYASQTARITIDSLQNIIDFGMQQLIKPFVKPDQFVKNQVSPLTSLDQLVTNFKQWKPSEFKKVKEQTNKILDQFPTEKNRLFLRYASDIVVSGKQGVNSKVNKFFDKAQAGVDFLNFFNKTQEFITRRAVVMSRLDELIRANPKYYNNKTLQQILKDGEHSKIRMSDIANAVDKALEVTFAKEFNSYKQKGGIYESVAAEVIKTINRLPYVLTSIIPFPRFLMNSLRFHAEFSPLGFLRFLSRKDRAKIAKGDTSGLSRALIGTAMLFAAMALRKQPYAANGL